MGVYMALYIYIYIFSTHVHKIAPPINKKIIWSIKKVFFMCVEHFDESNTWINNKIIIFYEGENTYSIILLYNIYENNKFILLLLFIIETIEILFKLKYGFTG